MHAKNTPIFLQLWALGRGAQAATLAKEGPYDVVSASNIPLSPGAGRASDVPRPLREDEIHEYVKNYARAAKSFVGAGGDGVEIHGAKCAMMLSGFKCMMLTIVRQRVRRHQVSFSGPQTDLYRKLSH